MRAIFRKAVHDTRRTTLWLSIGLVLYALFCMLFYPSMVKDSEKITELMESYPKGMMSMFYGGDVEDFDFAEPGTFIQTYVGVYAVLIIGVIAVVQAFNAMTNAERDGSMDLLLSLPVSRRDYLLGRMAGTALMLLVVLTSILATFWISTYIWTEFDVSIGRLTLGIYGGFLPLMVIAGFAYLLAAVIPSSRHFAGPLAYLFVIGSYLLYGFAVGVEALKDLRPLFLYNYYNAGDIIREGPNLGGWLLMAVVALVYLGAAWWLVDRKELGV